MTTDTQNLPGATPAPPAPSAPDSKLALNEFNEAMGDGAIAPPAGV